MAKTLEDGAAITARVTAVHRERYELSCDLGLVYARLKPGVYMNDGGEQYPTTGDFVTILYNTQGDSGIVRTHPRKSFFSRMDPDKSRPHEQVVAANFDYVFLLASLNQDFNLRRLERYLTLAWKSGATPVIVLTKSDLAADAAVSIAEAAAVAPGVDVVAVSAVTGDGLDALGKYLTPDSTAVFLGSSGVGKSSLLNALAGEYVMAVNTIREDDDKGRHTTTHRQLITLPSGASVIDTPGMRELGMWDATEGLSGTFADVEALLGNCRFSDCRHTSEPGCAILRAIETGELPAGRWDSYNRLKREALFAEDKAAAIREKNARFKEIIRSYRDIKKRGNKNGY